MVLLFVLRAKLPSIGLNQLDLFSFGFGLVTTMKLIRELAFLPQLTQMQVACLHSSNNPLS